MERVKNQHGVCETMARSESKLSRRRFVALTGTTGLTGIAGCMGGGTDGGGEDGGGTDGSGGEDGGTDEPLEVLHGWTGGDGKKAINNLSSVFKEQHPDMAANFKPIGGGGNENLNTVVANRLSNNNPPSSFANWPGKNLVKYEGVLGDVGDVWQDEGFTDAHVQEAIDLHKLNGAFRAVPLGSHRLNELFYNAHVVDDAGVDIESVTSVSKLIDAMDQVQQNTDKVPMTHGMKGAWTTLQLFAQVMLGQEGFDPYTTFINGNGGKASVRSTFETLKEILTNYINEDAASIGLTTSNQNIIKGNAAFIHQGNWAAGAFRNASDFVFGEDWGAKTFPGTEGMYTLHFDSFLYPNSNPSPEKAKTWLAFVGGTDAHVAFNKFKGSIPTRTDVSKSEFGPYLQGAIEDFAAADKRPPTLAHGLAVVPEKMTSLKDVISNEFSGPYNVEKATQQFMDTVSG